VTSLRLTAVETSDVTLYNYGGYVPLDLGVYVASVGGDVRIDARAEEHGHAPVANQVDAESGTVLRPIPAEMLDGWAGLKGFVRVTFTNTTGALVADQRFTFCPSGWDRQRVDDTGPPAQRYPSGCSEGFPFLRGMVWGIEEGWATSLFGSEEEGPTGAVSVPRGRYTVRVEVDPGHATLFGIAEEDAAVELDVRVRRPPSSSWWSEDPLADGRLEPQGAATEITDPDPSTLPDLAALPAWSIGVRNNARTGRSWLRFAASPWNAGPAPLVVEGFRSQTQAKTMDAFQYFYDEDGSVVGRAPTGTLVYHDAPGHHHWHFEMFALYTLLTQGPDGEEVQRSRKQGYCLVPTDAVDLTVPRAAFGPSLTGLATACRGRSALSVREVLDAGWADTYYQSVAGQAINITKIPNGTYILRVTVNPGDVLHEVTAANNVADRVIRLRGKKGARRVSVEPWNGVRA